MLILIVVCAFIALLYAIYRLARGYHKEMVLELISHALIEETLVVEFSDCGESLLKGQGFYNGTLVGSFEGHKLIVNAYFQDLWASQPHRLVIHLGDERLEWSVETPKALCGEEAQLLKSLDFYACRRGFKSLLPCKMKD